MTYEVQSYTASVLENQYLASIESALVKEEAIAQQLTVIATQIADYGNSWSQAQIDGVQNTLTGLADDYVDLIDLQTQQKVIANQALISNTTILGFSPEDIVKNTELKISEYETIKTDLREAIHRSFAEQELFQLGADTTKVLSILGDAVGPTFDAVIAINAFHNGQVYTGMATTVSGIIGVVTGVITTSAASSLTLPLMIGVTAATGFGSIVIGAVLETVLTEFDVLDLDELNLEQKNTEGLEKLAQIRQLFNALDSTITTSDMVRILDASAGQAGEHIDSFFSHIQELINGASQIASIEELALAITYANNIHGKGSFGAIDLTSFSATEITDLAAQDNNSGQAVRYALVNLLPVAFSDIEGTSADNIVYDLDKFDEAYLSDRSVMLEHYLDGLIDDRVSQLNDAGGLRVQSDLEAGEYYLFQDEDKKLDVTNYSFSPTPNYVFFGSNSGDEIIVTSGSEANRVHGLEGDDVIKGASGRDALFGGLGSDYLHGGSESDTLFGGKGNDHLHGDAGNDFLYGGDGDDTYYYVSGDGHGQIYDVLGNDRLNINSQLISVITALDESETIFKDDFGNTYHLDDMGAMIVTIGDDNQTGTIRLDQFDKVTNNFGLMMTEYEPPAIEQTTEDTVTINDKALSSLGAVYSYSSAIINNYSGREAYNQDWINQKNIIFDAASYYSNSDPDSSGFGYFRAFEAGIGNDYLVSGDDSNHLSGASGNDTLLGNGGNDRLEGGAGKDHIEGGAGSDTIWGSSEAYRTSNLELYLDVAAEHSNYLAGDAGVDFISGGTQKDEIYGGTEGDYIHGGAGLDDIFGGAGDDLILGDSIHRYWAKDLDPGSVINPQMKYSVEFSEVTSSQGDNDTISGGEGHDVIMGESGEDTVFGGSGDDSIWGDRSASLEEYLAGVTVGGLDSLAYDTSSIFLSETEHGNDTLFGGAGRDDIYGNAGDDYIDGGTGNDTLAGGRGNDTVIGGEGNDAMTGGEGDDSFILNLGDGHDIIRDESGITTITLNGITKENISFYQDDATGQVGIIYKANGDEWRDANAVWMDNDTFSRVARVDMAGASVDPIEEVGFHLKQEVSSNAIKGPVTIEGSDGVSLFSLPAGYSLLTGMAAYNHELLGNAGNNYLYVREGSNILDGGLGDDILDGGSGNDLLMAGAGDDHLYGDEGDDLLDGGEGENTYWFYAEDTGTDTLVIDPLAIDILRFEGQDYKDFTAKEEGESLVIERQDGLQTVIVNDWLASNFELYIGDEKIIKADILGVLADNNQPLLDQGISDITTLEDAAFSLSIPADAFSDFDGDMLTYSAKEFGENTLPEWLSFDGTKFLGTPSNDFVGAVQIEVTASDANASVSTLFNLMVENTNDAPEVSLALANMEGNEGERLSFSIPAGSFRDVDAGDSLAYTATLSDGSALPAWLSFDADTQTFSGTPNVDDVETLSLEVTASDLSGGSVSDVFNVTVSNKLNQAPFTEDDFTVNNDDTSDIIDDLSNDSDAGNDILIVNSVIAENASLAIADTQLEVNGGMGGDIIHGGAGDDRLSSGADSDEIYGEDGDDDLEGGEGEDKLFGGNGNDVLRGGEGNDELSGGLGDDQYLFGDPNGISIGHDIIKAGEQGYESLYFGGSLSSYSIYLVGDDLIVAHESGAFSVTIEEWNISSGLDTTLEFFIDFDDEDVDATLSHADVKAILDSSSNDAPIANPDTASVSEDATVTIDVLSNDSDLNGDSLNIDSATAANGSVTINPDGTLLYTPDSGFSGSDSISYSINDNKGGAAISTVMITVNAKVDTSGSGDEIIDLIGNNSLDGSDQNDVLVTGDGDDILSGLSGHDYLLGGAGSDTYVIGANSGHDIVVDTEGSNTIYFTDGIVFNDVASGLVKADDDLVLTVGTGGDQVRIVNFFSLANTVEKLEFESGGEISATELFSAFGLTAPSATTLRGELIFGDGSSNELKGLTTHDVLFSGGGNDTLSGLAGNDQMIGGNGNDIYVVGANGGQDTVIDTVGSNIIRFTEDLTFNDVARSLTKLGDDLVLNVGVGGDQVRIVNFFSLANTINKLEFESGGEISANQLFDVFSVLAPTATAETFDVLSDVVVGGGDSNNVPFLISDTASTNEDVFVTIDVLTNDSDLDGDSLTVSTASAENGLVVINSDGTLTYTPNVNFKGSDLINYEVSDDRGGISNSTVEVTVNAVNEDLIGELATTGFASESEPLTATNLENTNAVTENPESLTGPSANDPIYGLGGIDQLVNAMAAFGSTSGGAIDLSSDEQQQVSTAIAVSWQ